MSRNAMYIRGPNVGDEDAAVSPAMRRGVRADWISGKDL